MIKQNKKKHHMELGERENKIPKEEKDEKNT